MKINSKCMALLLICFSSSYSNGFFEAVKSGKISDLFIKKTIAERKNLGERKTVKVLTLNIGLMSVFFGTISIGLKENKKRAFLIGQAIKNMSDEQKPDVIAFQEAFDKRRIRSYLYPQIKKDYPYSYYDERVGAYLGGVGSGLVLFSKYPLRRKTIVDYSCWAGVEALARKAIMGVELSVDGCPFYLFSTHLQAGVDKDWYIKMFGVRPRSCEGISPNELNSDEIRLVELRQAKREINKFLKTSDYKTIKAPILLVGDFNISKDRDWLGTDDNKLYIYNKMVDEIFTGVHDTYETGSKKIKSTQWHDGKVAESETYRVDYALVLNPSKDINAHSNIVDIFTEKMTDHLGTLVEVSFTCY